MSKDKNCEPWNPGNLLMVTERLPVICPKLGNYTGATSGYKWLVELETRFVLYNVNQNLYIAITGLYLEGKAKEWFYLYMDKPDFPKSSDEWRHLKKAFKFEFDKVTPSTEKK